MVEPLEARKLLSAAVTAAAPVAEAVQVHPDSIFLHRPADLAAPAAAAAPAASSAVVGYSPSQIRHAYGFDQVAFNDGTVPAEGQGQTIAIVDAFQDPNITADLGVFDAQFALPAPPSFQIVNQRGGGQLPSSAGADAAGWAGETSLDVEWAHAVAPQARILLVETDSDSLANLTAGVDYARKVPGVSVISMSWGGSEFFGFSAGNESGSETQYDDTFTTPAGHDGVTFVAAAGDSGASQGVQFPAASPNVLSVGGTSLTLAADGTYVGEQSWDGTSGGTSQVEPEPPYQSAAQGSGSRNSPDVSYDGDPNTGFAVYDSIPSQGQVGWQQVGGTSAGAPQWAALVAIANQGRALAGQPSLDGNSQTLPLLYSPYAAPDTAGYANYAATYHDVTDTGSSAVIHWRWGGTGGGFSNPATAGFDTATGLGSPVAPQVVSLLVGSPTSTPTPTPTPTPGPTPTPSPTPTPTPSPSPQQLPASPVSASFAAAPPAAVRGGATGTTKLLLANTSGQRFNGPVAITLYASSDDSAADGTSFANFTIPKLALRAGASKKYTLKFNYPDSLDGSYFLVASVDATGGATQTSQPATATQVTIAKPFVDLATTFGDQTSVLVVPGAKDGVSVTLRNQGNVSASGTVSINLYQAPGQTLDVNADALLGGLAGKKINLRPGQSKTLRIRFVDPPDAAGTYQLIAATTLAAPFPDNNPANDVAVIGTM